MDMIFVVFHISYTFSVVLISQFYHSSDDDAMAIKKMQDARQKYPALLDNEAVNILTELLIATKNYEEAFQVQGAAGELITTMTSNKLFAAFLI